ncbi:hypothetical protein NBRC111894_3560 [Sporolactobacillus inulinus]|uniref:Uncharacterized protein n=1 Tax=Sporolactobacillus inulinus TaxID=2078 RepID=A0A4Y1ZFR0_9BACL|nr:hypothetical protein NBRC111894_3560 [Sporolactobacillus inulinus]
MSVKKEEIIELFEKLNEDEKESNVQLLAVPRKSQYRQPRRSSCCRITSAECAHSLTTAGGRIVYVTRNEPKSFQ